MTSSNNSPLHGGFDEPMGRYTYDVPTKSWWWSDEMYAIHGFAPGEVVPTTALLHAHKHPDDYEYAVKTLETVLLEATEYCCRYRIVDAAARSAPSSPRANQPPTTKGASCGSPATSSTSPNPSDSIPRRCSRSP